MNRQSIFMNSKALLIFFTVALFSAGCSTVRVQPVKLENGLEAGLIMDKLRKTNPSLVNFKSSGHIDIKNDDEMINARTVMCVSPPHSFRLEALNPAGQPEFRMSGNGEHIYVQPEPDSRIYENEAKGATLEKLAGIEIQVMDLINLLCGRLPEMPDGSVADLKNDPNDKNVRNLVVYDMTGNVIQNVSLDEKNGIKAIETFDSSGKTIYNAEFTGKKEVSGFVFPGRIFVRAGLRQLKLALRQILPNTEIKEDLFVLTSQPAGVKK